MSKMKPAQLVDVTVKEGGALVHYNLLAEQVADLARELERSRLRHMEISHGRGVGALKAGYPGLLSEREFLESAKAAAPGLKFWIYIATYPYSLFEIEPLAPYFDVGRVGINIDEVEKGIEYVKRVKQAGKTAAAQLLRVHRATPAEVAAAAVRLESQGADLVYVSDTFGSMDAADTANYVGETRARVKIPVGFQGTNYTGRAVENTLAAWEAGAEWLDGSILGMGPGGGMAPMEILTALFQERGAFPDADLKELTYAAKWQVAPVFKKIPRPDYLHLLFAKHRIDYSTPDLVPMIADVLELDAEEFLLRLQDSRPGVVQLREADLRDYLSHEGIDWDVLLEYFKTGKVPETSE